MAMSLSTSASSSAAATSKPATPALLDGAIIFEPIGEHRATIVWLHGLGDSGEGFSDVFESYRPQNTRVVLPNAPIRSVTINSGMKMRAWYDILTLDRSKSPPIREDEKGIVEGARQITELLAYEVAKVGGADKVLLGGFSQGGAMSIHAGLSYASTLAGVISCSGYVLLQGQYPSAMSSAGSKVQVFAYHGTQDQTVPMSFAKTGYDALKKHGANIDFNVEKYLEHSLSGKELEMLSKWWCSRLKVEPPKSTEKRNEDL